MTAVAYLGWALWLLTVADRFNHSRRWWWAPIFGVAIQVPWCVYGWMLGPGGYPLIAMAALIGLFYGIAIPKWLRTRK